MSKVYIQTPEQFNEVFFKAVPSEGNRLIYNVRVFDKKGSDITSDFYAIYEEVHVKGPEMPEKIMITPKAGAPYDVGAELPMAAMGCKEGTLHKALSDALLKKVEDAVIALVYGLNKEGMFVKSIERVVFNAEKKLYTPRVHYSTGESVDVLQKHVTELPDNHLKYLMASQMSEHMFFTDFTLERASTYHKPTKTLYRKFMLNTKFGANKLKREKKLDPTPAQLDRANWGIQINRVVKNDAGKWEPQEDVFPTMKVSSGRDDFASFTGNVFLQARYVFAGKEYALKYGGIASFIKAEGTGATTASDLYGDFASDDASSGAKGAQAAKSSADDAVDYT